MKSVFLFVVFVALAIAAGACGSSSNSGSASPAAGIHVTPTPLIAGGDPPYVRIATGSSGKQYLTDPNGMTLYVLKDDSPVYSGGPCPDECLATWVPLLAPLFAVITPTAGLNGPLGTFRRTGLPEDVRQVYYQGKPLYRYARDHAPGDQNGDGIDGKWSVAAP